MQPDDSISASLARKTAKSIVDHGSVPMATLKESIILQEKVDELLAKEIVLPEQQPFPELPEYPTEISVSNLPEIQKVVVTNFPEQKAPIVNVEAPKAPIVKVEAPIINLDNDEVIAELKNISDILSKEEEKVTEKTEIVDEEGGVVDFKKLFDSLRSSISNIRISGGGGGGLNQDQLRATLLRTTDTITGASANGQVELTSANTWYAVPSSVPTGDYVLVVTQEVASGTIRWGFDNTGTPSATNGNQAPNQLTIRLAAGQVIYYASSTALDDVNWTTKII